MLPWVLREPERLQREIDELEALRSEAVWLRAYDWSLADGLCVDAVIRAHRIDYTVRLMYPALYPDAPAYVQPIGYDTRLSGHQYGGASGPLCLEWGPDNWHNGVTGAELLRSAYRLFDTENPLGQPTERVAEQVASRHALTPGQELRSEALRAVITPGLQDCLAEQPAHSCGKFTFSFRNAEGTFVIVIHSLQRESGELWKEEHAPSNLGGLEDKDHLSGIWCGDALDAAFLSSVTDRRSLFGEAAKTIAEPTRLLDEATQDKSSRGFLAPDTLGGVQVFFLLRDESVVRAASVVSTRHGARVLATDSGLTSKKIGIVGAGSVGSKIAASLARAGVRRFHLVDSDVLLPENLGRHELDWQGVGLHKVVALKAALLRIDASTEVSTSTTHLVGQESSAVLMSDLEDLSACDLLVDATANSRVFNLLAAITRSSAKPMVWGEVFAGGVGGLVAMSRPGVDPLPQDMRQTYLAYCAENPPPPDLLAATDYDGGSADQPLQGLDAHVGVIANALTLMAVACLGGPEVEQPPYSMYLVGMKREWVFAGPFAVHPISVAWQPVSPATEAGAARVSAESLAFIAKLLGDDASP